MPEDDLVCPECGGPIGTTSAYCMHCSADLTDRHPTRDDVETHPTREAVDGDSSSDGVWMKTNTEVVDLDALRDDETTAHQQDLPPAYRSTSGAVDRTKLLPDGFVLKAVTFLLAMAAGSAVGIGSMYVLSGSLAGWLAFLLGVLAWFGSTAAFLRVVPG